MLTHINKCVAEFYRRLKEPPADPFFRRFEQPAVVPDEHYVCYNFHPNHPSFVAEFEFEYRSKAALCDLGVIPGTSSLSFFVLTPS